MLTISNLTVEYQPGQPVLRDLELALKAGTVNGLVARNGEGKTTLLNTIFGILTPATGTIEWEGQRIKPSDIAYLETEQVFYPLITGAEYLGIFKASNPLFDRWNDVFELPLQEYVQNYSTGMKKKLALMAVLSFDRPLLMLDEPFNGLDIESNMLLVKILRMAANSGKTVLVTSHILESLTSLCDSIHLLSQGRIERTFNQSEMADLGTELWKGVHEKKSHLLNSLL